MNPTHSDLQELERPAQIVAWLATLFPWLNANLPIDPRKALTEQDVAHIGLTAEEFAQIPVPVQTCAWKKIEFKRAYGMEFWLRSYALPPIQDVSGFRGRIAWLLTGNTAALFRFRHGGRNNEKDGQ